MEDNKPFSSNTGVSIVTPPWRSFNKSAIVLLPLSIFPYPTHTKDIDDGSKDLFPENHVRAGPWRLYDQYGFVGRIGVFGNGAQSLVPLGVLQ